MKKLKINIQVFMSGLCKTVGMVFPAVVPCVKLSSTIKYFLVSLSIILLGGCRTYSDPQMYHKYESRALAVKPGDIYLISVQGKGQTRKDAVNNALMQAVRDVIFKDIQVTYGDHRTLMRLINNPAEEEKHSEFFSRFFSPAGDYRRFVTPESKNREYFSSSNFQTVILNVKVNRKALKDYLSEADIL